jgi:Phage integrase family
MSAPSSFSISDLRSPRGAMWDEGNFRERVFDPAKKRAELDEMIFHDLRHTYASLLIAANVQPMVVAEQLGHTDARLVLQRYGHLYPGAAAQAAMALDLYLRAATVGRCSEVTARARTSGRKRRWMLMERAGLEPATPSLQSQMGVIPGRAALTRNDSD